MEPSMADSTRSTWMRLVRDVRDFPKPGIVFKDIAPVLANADGFAAAIASLAAPWRDHNIDAVLAIEARGFILGAPLARALSVGFVPLRKPGKLPGRTLKQTYALEYGQDALELQARAYYWLTMCSPPAARSVQRTHSPSSCRRALSAPAW
jgi:adenine phosphoribosyltransferase